MHTHKVLIASILLFSTSLAMASESGKKREPRFPTSSYLSKKPRSRLNGFANRLELDFGSGGNFSISNFPISPIKCDHSEPNSPTTPLPLPFELNYEEKENFLTRRLDMNPDTPPSKPFTLRKVNFSDFSPENNGTNIFSEDDSNFVVSPVTTLRLTPKKSDRTEADFNGTTPEKNNNTTVNSAIFDTPDQNTTSINHDANRVTGSWESENNPKSFRRKHTLGSGSFSSVIAADIDGKKRAIKLYNLTCKHDINICKAEFNKLRKMEIAGNPLQVHYYWAEGSDEYQPNAYIVMDKAEKSLKDINFHNESKEFQKLFVEKFPEAIILLKKFHKNGISHMDIKLDNLLWIITGKDEKDGKIAFADPLTKESGLDDGDKDYLLRLDFKTTLDSQLLQTRDLEALGISGFEILVGTEEFQRIRKDKNSTEFYIKMRAKLLKLEESPNTAIANLSTEVLTLIDTYGEDMGLLNELEKIKTAQNSI